MRQKHHSNCSTIPTQIQLSVYHNPVFCKHSVDMGIEEKSEETQEQFGLKGTS